MTKSQQIHDQVTAAIMKRVEAELFIKRLRSDTFWRLFFDYSAVIGELEERIVSTIWLSLRQKNNQRPSKQEPTFLSNLPAFREKRAAAMQNTIPLLILWMKAGVPGERILDVLQKIQPAYRKFFAQLDSEHKVIVSSLERQKRACERMTHDDASTLIALSEDLRRGIMEEVPKAVELYTNALTKYAKAALVLEKAKAQFVHIRNVSKRDAETRLMKLRKRYVKKEKSTTRARRSEQLLKAWDPEVTWNYQSIRVGRNCQ